MKKSKKKLKPKINPKKKAPTVIHVVITLRQERDTVSNVEIDCAQGGDVIVTAAEDTNNDEF